MSRKDRRGCAGPAISNFRATTVHWPKAFGAHSRCLAEIKVVQRIEKLQAAIALS
jgi:hypothetical protein